MNNIIPSESIRFQLSQQNERFQSQILNSQIVFNHDCYKKISDSYDNYFNKFELYLGLQLSKYIVNIDRPWEDCNTTIKIYQNMIKTYYLNQQKKQIIKSQQVDVQEAISYLKQNYKKQMQQISINLPSIDQFIKLFIFKVLQVNKQCIQQYCQFLIIVIKNLFQKEGSFSQKQQIKQFFNSSKYFSLKFDSANKFKFGKKIKKLNKKKSKQDIIKIQLQKLLQGMKTDFKRFMFDKTDREIFIKRLKYMDQMFKMLNSYNSLQKLKEILQAQIQKDKIRRSYYPQFEACKQ